MITEHVAPEHVHVGNTTVTPGELESLAVTRRVPPPY
jgi:hypothetical protein